MSEPQVDTSLLHRPMRLGEVFLAFGSRRPQMLESVLTNDTWVGTYGDLFADRERLLADEETEVLDATVPDELSRALAEVSDVEYELQEAAGGLFLLRELGSSDCYAQDPDSIERLTAAQVHDRFGGGVIGRVHESGSCYVPDEDQSAVE
jgi:hypothetical protein